MQMKIFDKIAQHCRHLDEIFPQFDFQRGDCYRFFVMFRRKFPEATALYDGNHIYCFYLGRLWDSRGLVMYPLESEPRIKEDALNWSSK